MSQRINRPSIFIDNELIEIVPDSVILSTINGVKTLHFKLFNILDNLKYIEKWESEEHEVRINFNIQDTKEPMILKRVILNNSRCELITSGIIDIEFRQLQEY